MPDTKGKPLKLTVITRKEQNRKTTLKQYLSVLLLLQRKQTFIKFLSISQFCPGKFENDFKLPFKGQQLKAESVSCKAP